MKTETLDAQYEKYARAMFMESLPCNATPFRNACDRYVNAGGDPKSDTFKAMAWMVLSIKEGQLATVDISPGSSPGWLDLEWAYGDLKTLDMQEEWKRLCEVFNPPMETRATVRMISGPRVFSNFIASAGLGVTGAGVESTLVISYKPGEKVDEARVRRAMEAVVKGLDESNDPTKILTYEIVSIVEKPITQHANQHS